MTVMQRQEQSTTGFNSTFVRPAKFYLSGFTNVPHVKYYYVFLCFVYIMTVLGNGFLLSVICMVKTLHTPKYMIVFNLALTDLCGSTALTPKLLDMFLFDRRDIVYEACLSYMFFVLFFTGLQSWILVMMAYDRFVAICFPLRYHSIVTTKSIFLMLLSEWILLVCLMAMIVGFITRISFCGSVEIKSFFCDHGPTIRLACNDNTPNYTLATFGLVVFMCFPLVLIILTYVCISVSLSRTASKLERFRALKTCTSHLILVALFYLPFVATNIAALSSQIEPNIRMLNSSLTNIIPSLINPIIYSLKTQEMRETIKRLWKRSSLNKIVTK